MLWSGWERQRQQWHQNTAIKTVHTIFFIRATWRAVGTSSSRSIDQLDGASLWCSRGRRNRKDSGKRGLDDWWGYRVTDNSRQRPRDHPFSCQLDRCAPTTILPNFFPIPLLELEFLPLRWPGWVPWSARGPGWAGALVDVRTALVAEGMRRAGLPRCRGGQGSSVSPRFHGKAKKEAFPTTPAAEAGKADHLRAAP